MTRAPEELHFTAPDGARLFYRHWPALSSDAGEVRAILLFHRGHEHSGRLQHIVDELDLPGHAFFAWDLRGLGRSPGERGYAEGFAQLAADADAFARHLAAAHGVREENLAVVAQSVGAVIAAAWAHDYAPRLRAMVLASPAFKVKLYVPGAVAALRLGLKFRKKFFINSYVKAKFLTRDVERQRSYDADPLITRPIAANLLVDLFDVSGRLVADAGALQVPTQILCSGADWVVEKKPQRRFFAGLSSPVKEWREFPGFYHDTLGEKDRAPALAEIRRFVLERFAAPSADDPAAAADRAGFTFEEFRRLAAPLPAWHPRRAAFALIRLFVRTLGRASEGLRLGARTGFDSGSTLDYVYRNEARGWPLVGTRFDRVYLDSVGWKGIRKRKANLEALLAEAAARLRAEGREVRVLDVAAGHGRYVLDGLAAAGGEWTARLRDFSELNVEAGRALIAARGLAGRASFERGDAFDGAGLAALTPRPTLAIVSGLYELFPENAPLRGSLGGLAAAVEPGGFLIYTGQPWHPQLEAIARVLTSHRDGKAWVMRRRTQAELDALVREAGFEKVAQKIDRWGIFTVSLARRVA